MLIVVWLFLLCFFNHEPQLCSNDSESCCSLSQNCTAGQKRGLEVTDVQIEQLVLLKFTRGLSWPVHTEAYGHFDLQREMSWNEGQ